MNDGSIICIKESLAVVAAMLHRRELFVKCHRSFVVNLAYVEKISARSVRSVMKRFCQSAAALTMS